MRAFGWSFLLLAWFVLASCTTEPGCDICTTSAVVYGRVTTSSGSAVVGARLRVEAFRDTCGVGFAIGQTNVEPFTAADGSYRDQPYSLAAPFRACLRVTVTPTVASGFAPRTVEGAQVQFLDDYRPRGRDSVRVDVTLQP